MSKDTYSTQTINLIVETSVAGKACGPCPYLDESPDEEYVCCLATLKGDLEIDDSGSPVRKAGCLAAQVAVTDEIPNPPRQYVLIQREGSSIVRVLGPFPSTDIAWKQAKFYDHGPDGSMAVHKAKLKDEISEPVGHVENKCPPVAVALDAMGDYQPVQMTSTGQVICFPPTLTEEQLESAARIWCRNAGLNPNQMVDTLYPESSDVALSREQWLGIADEMRRLLSLQKAMAQAVEETDQSGK